MLDESQSAGAIRKALRMYLFIGVVLVAVGVRSWHPGPAASYVDQAVWVVSEVIFWPKVFAHNATRSGAALWLLQ